MAAGLGFLTLHDFRGGRNGADPLTAIPETQCADAINVDWYRGMLARRRPGASLCPGGPPSSLTRAIFSLIRFIPGRSETQTRLFAFDRDGLRAAYFITNAGWADTGMGTLDLTHGIVHGVSFNGKLFLAGANTTDTLHYYDAVENSIKTVGIAAPTAPPVVTPSGVAGSVTGLRFYKIRWTQRSGTVTVRRSEMSSQAGLSITSQTGWKITRPADPLDETTHWELYGAAAGDSYYLLNTVPIATTFTLDQIAPASFPPLNAVLAPIEGAYTPAPNGKYLLVDESRLLIANTTTDPSRVWWTPILNDASGDGNDERVNVSQRPWIDFDPGDSGEITGLGGPLFDSPYIFKMDRVYKMVRTGLALAAYRPVTVSKKCGALHHRTIVLGDDETGNECLYFLSRRGPYRVGVQGVQYCGRDIEDLWATVNLNTAAGRDDAPAAHGVYHADLHQVWWWVPTTLDCSTLRLVFDTRLGQFTQVDGVRAGWAQHTGQSARTWCSEMFADAVTEPLPPEEDSLHLKPYFSQAGPDGLPDDVPRVWMGDYGYTDHGAGYIASVRSRGIVMSETIALHGGVLEGHVIVSPGVHNFTVSTLRDYGVEVRTSAPFAVTAVPPTMLGFPLPRVLLPVRDLAAVSCAVLQIEYADTPLSEIWELDQIVLRVRREEDR